MSKESERIITAIPLLRQPLEFLQILIWEDACHMFHNCDLLRNIIIMAFLLNVGNVQRMPRQSRCLIVLLSILLALKEKKKKCSLALQQHLFVGDRIYPWSVSMITFNGL